MSALTSFLPSTNKLKFNRTLTKVHNRPQKRLYKRLHSDDEINHVEEEDSDENNVKIDLLATELSSSEEDLAPELVELSRMRNVTNYVNSNTSDTSRDNFVEKELEDGDTLQSLALKYGCKVSELKRKNNIINEPEFYGLRTIKIPVKKYSLAEEKLLQEIEMKTHRNRMSSSSEDQNRSKLSTSPRKLRIGDSLFGENRQGVATFLEQMDIDLENMRQSIKTRKDTLEEVTQVLTCKSIMPLGNNRMISQKSTYFKTRILILLIIIILVIFPIVIILLIKFGKSKT